MRPPTPIRIVAFLAAMSMLFIAFGTASASSLPWYTGQRALGHTSIEPAVDDMTGQQVFLSTPIGAPFPSQVALIPPCTSRGHCPAEAPLYLVAYPTTSTITDAFNCTPTTCDHAAAVPFPWYPSGGLLKGHDHLVGIAATGGDYNVAWDVELDYFTPQGFGDGAINTRILTLAQLNAAKLAGDIDSADIGIVFNCSSVGAATYLHATPLTFSL